MKQTNATLVSDMHLVSITLFMFVLPLVSIGIEHFLSDPLLPVMDLIGKWFLFWAVGVRLLTAGLRQAVDPVLAAKSIFHQSAQDSFALIRELGFANICLGLMAILSVFVPPSRPVAACAGGFFFGIAGITHHLKKPLSPAEWIAMVSDIFIASVMLGFVLVCL
ncbi:hypothetical protein GCM10028805_52980 [Spirosoma harenae]